MNNDIWVISCYFNPLHFRTRRENFRHFAEGLESQGARLLVIEMADAEGDFDLDASRFHCIRVRGDGLIWQKERMLNLALEHVPSECTKVVWADGDLLFESPDWLSRTSAALEDYVVVQPFDRCIRLPRGHLSYRGETQEGSEPAESFAACFARDPSLAHHEIYRNHGHTGFAWAARRDFLDACGFYDRCLTGSSDHLMAHVFAGALASDCIPKMIGEGHTFARDFAAWAEKAHCLCDGRLGHISGRVLHLWHGTLGNRRYFSRNQEFKTFDYQPDRDIRMDNSGLWEWTGASPFLREWSEAYFASRDEDGSDQSAPT